MEMKYRISSIKIKKQFQEAHKKQWNRIIEKASDESQFLSRVKKESVNELFDHEIIANCFGCYWREIKPKHKCLFNIRKPCNKTCGLCLDGLYYKALCIFRENSKVFKIAIAKQIRDFPIK
jgi:hypothetical protein